MKKVLLLSAFAIFGMSITSVNAQKPIGGDKNFEFNFSPLGGNPLDMNGIRFRYFLDESSAVRVGFHLGGSKDQMATFQEGEAGDGSPVMYDTENTFAFSLRPGYEMHLDGTDRMSPYFGAVLDFTTTTEKSAEEGWGFASEDAVSSGTGSVYTQTNIDGSTSFGLNLVAGMDYYFADNFYLGVELGFGYMSTNEKDSKVEVDNKAAWSWAMSGGSDFNMDVPDNAVNGKSNAWGPNFNSSFRLGWLIN